MAGKIVSTINAALSNVPMSARPAIYDQIHDRVLARFIGPQAQPNQIVDAADLTNFLDFFQELQRPGLEEFNDVMLERFRTRSITTMAPAITVRDAADKDLFFQLVHGVSQPGMEGLKAALLDRLRGVPMISIDGSGQAAAQPRSDAAPIQPVLPSSNPPLATMAAATAAPMAPMAFVAPTALVPQDDQGEAASARVSNPTVWSDAANAYIASLAAQNAVEAKTLKERRKLLNQLEDFMVREYKFARRFYVHQVRKFHIADFADHSAKRPARGVKKTDAKAASASGEAPQTIKPGTQIKRNSTLGLFFDWAVNEREATNIDPTDGLEKRNGTLKKQKAETSDPYIPFTHDNVVDIFKPGRYLAHFRVPDYFWTPLLGIHLGARLGELVNAKLCDIKHHDLSDIWYIDLQPEDVKNKNSVRRLPITQPLIDLGFLEYVDRLRELGAAHLFPHRDMAGSTAEDQPSKNVSGAFARFLDVCGLSDPGLVFHSFRHTVVTALQLANVPLMISQQIVGHAAQDHAIATGRMTREQARGVTVNTYSHADIPSMTMADPFKGLKDTLENNLTLPLDYPRLKKAAAIVLEHVQKSPGARTGFKAGWAPQKKGHTDLMLKRLG